MANVEAAKAWLNSVVSAYSAFSGVSFARAAAPAAGIPVAAAPAAASGEMTISAPDAPLPVLDVVRTIVALKIRKSYDQVPGTATIQSLVGGKSALQNEILGDISAEFGISAPGAESMPLTDLAKHATGYSQMGKITSGFVGKLISSKFPGGFTLSSVKSHLSKKGFGQGRSDAILVRALTMDPTNFGSEDEARTWLDKVISQYCSENGITMGAASSGAAVGGAVAIDTRALAELEGKNMLFYKRQLEVLNEVLGNAGLSAEEKLRRISEAARLKIQQDLDVFMSEVGEEFANGIHPVLHITKGKPLAKKRIYDSSWNWVRQGTKLEKTFFLLTFL